MANRSVKRVAKGVSAIALTALAAVTTVLIALSVDHRKSTPLPAPSGSYHVGRATYSWRDEARINLFAPVANTKQDLAVWIWYPAAPAASAKQSGYLPVYWIEALQRHEGFLLGHLLSRDLTRV